MMLNFLKIFFSNIAKVILLFSIISVVTIFVVSSEKTMLNKRVTEINNLRNINYTYIAKNNNVKNETEYFFDNLYLYTENIFNVKIQTNNGFKYVLADTMMELDDVIYNDANYITKDIIVSGEYSKLNSDEMAISMKTANLYGLAVGDILKVEIIENFNVDIKIKYIYNTTLGLFNSDIHDDKGTLIFGDNNLISQSIAKKQYYLYSNVISNNLFNDIYFIDSYERKLNDDVFATVIKIIAYISSLGIAIELIFIILGDFKRVQVLLDNNFKISSILFNMTLSKSIIYLLVNIFTFVLLIALLRTINLVPIYLTICLSTLLSFVLISLVINSVLFMKKRLI